MGPINGTRVLLGGVVGGIAWIVLGILINVVFLGSKYPEAQAAGHFLPSPRWGLFVPVWMLTLLLLGVIVAWIYAGVRETWGPGPLTALKVGLVVGFAAGFPLSFANASWSPVATLFPLCWMLELWGGAIVASLLAGWLYKER